MQGILSLEDCVCVEDLWFDLHMSQYEPEVSQETLMQFDSMHSPHRIKIIKTKLEGQLDLNFHPNVSRRLLIDSINDRLMMLIYMQSPDSIKQKYVIVFDI